MPHPTERRIPLTIGVSQALKAELELEAWECQRTLADYCRGLLQRRGKWARSVGQPGGYDLQISELAQKKT